MSYRIVIAEDEPDIRANLARLLQLEQYTVWAACDGQEALALVRAHLPDLLLSDVMMPHMGGHALVQSLRADPALAHIPAIFLTARAEHSDRREAMSLGADDYLVKPFKREELLDAVRSRLDRSAAHHAARQQLQQQARRLQHFDALTQLPNRAHLLTRCALAQAQAERMQARVAVAVIALDGLGQLTQALGHAGGDTVLCEMAQRLQAILQASEHPRELDTVGRLSGPHFALLLEGFFEPAALQPWLQQVCQALAAPCTVQGRDVFLEARIGVALAQPQAAAEDVLRQAEVALDQTLEAGVGRIDFFNPARDTRVARRMLLHSALHRALEAGQLSLHYQAQVDIRSQRIVGFEALMRWQHPSLGAVSPAEFIPLAEESGLIVAMGAWALDQACAQLRAWQDAGLAPVRVAVNLSPRQFDHAELLAEVDAALQRHALAPALLELEITESVALQGVERTVATLAALKARGLALAIDDFGTGYSSLGYLKRFPVDALKVDQSFVRSMDSDAGDAAIVRAVIALAHSFGLGVIAEGVETPAQLACLAALGCDYAQGYYFSRPLPPAQAVHLLRHGLGAAA